LSSRPNRLRTWDHYLLQLERLEDRFAPSVTDITAGHTGTFATIQAAVNFANPGDTILVDAGTYHEHVTVNKALTLQGANHGVNPLTSSRGAESIVDGDFTGAPFMVTASNVVLDGFKIVDGQNGSNAGVALGGSISGYTVENNVITNNTIGIYANSSGVSLIQHNLFDGNNLPGPAGGAGIYSESTIGLTVDANEFRNQTQNNPIIFAATSATSHVNLTVTNNYIHDNVTGIYALGINGGLFQGNTISTNGTATGLTFGGSDTNVKVLNNDLSNNARGLRIANFQDASYIGPNSNITAHFNSFASDSTFGVGIVDPGTGVNGYTGTLDVSLNWWGDVSGPTSSNNPGGKGSILQNDFSSDPITFRTWLIYGNAAIAGTTGFVLPATINVTAGGDISAADNDYTRLANAIGSVQSGQTLVLSGTFDWTKPFAAAAWAKGNDGIAGTADDYTICAPANVNNVTITAASPGAATIQGPGSIAGVYLEGPLQFNTGNNADRAYGASTNQNWTISNLNIYDFALGIGFFDNPGGNSAAFTGTHIANNHIRLAPDVIDTANPASTVQNIGIHYSFGQNQLIQNNIIDLQGNGVSDSANNHFSSEVGMQGNTSGGNVYDGFLIDSNTVNVLHAPSSDPERIRGIWENTDGTTSNITVSNNKFVNLDPANDPAKNSQIAFRLTSPSSATSTIRYQNNQVSGAHVGFQYYPGYDNTGTQPVQIIGNTLTNVFDGFDFANAKTVNYLSGNTVTGTGGAGTTGIAVGVGSTLTTDGVSGTDAVSNFATGVDVSGTATLTQNTITGNGTGVHVEAGGSLVSASQNFITGSTGDGILIDAAAGTVNPITNNNLSGNGGLGVDNLGSTVLDAGLNWWGDASGPNVASNPGGTGSGVSTHVDYSPWLTTGTDVSASPGFQGDISQLTVNPGSPRTAAQVAAGTANIQEGINDVLAGGTVTARQGIYAENVIVNKSVTLVGANNTNPVPGRSGAESVVEPGLTSNYDTDSAFLVTANNVIIEGFTIQGSIASPPSGQSAGFTLTSGTKVYAAAGISNSTNVNTGGSAPSTTNISGLTVRNNIIQDFTQLGVYGDTSDGTVSTGNVIADNVITDVPNNGQGGYIGEGVLIYDNFYADVTGNKITNVRTGIQTGNNYLPAGTFTPSISDNIVSATVKGVYYNLQYQSASPFTISGNKITQYDGSVSPAYNVGLLVQSISVPSVIQGNNVSGFLYGVEFAGNSGTQTVTLKGGTLDHNTYGVWATNNDYFYPAPYNTTAALDGVTITNSTNTGVWVDSTSANSQGQFNTTNTVTLAVTDGTTLTGGPVGLLVDGAHSLASLTQSTISGNGTGVHVETGGSLTSAAQNFITHNTGDGILIDATAGAVPSIFDNDLSGNAGAALNYQAATPVNAAFNWWGSPTGPTIATNPGGTGGVLTDPNNHVTFSPFLGSGTDTQPATPGFQGDLSVSVKFNVKVSHLEWQAGINVGTGTIGSFTDPAGAEALSTYTADIAWGDGFGDRGVISFDPASNTFFVKGGHVYGHEGNYTVTVTVYVDNVQSGMSTNIATMADAPMFITSFTPPPARPGFFSNQVATFVDDDKGAVTADFQATIDWGDGTTSTGAIYSTSYDSMGHPNLAVFGTHTYLAAPTGSFRVTITDLRGGTTTSKANDGMGALEYTVYFDAVTGTYKVITFRY
jgi:nitrous oxidase accessory protein NosD